MPKNEGDATHPTMIIPRGTEIQVDSHGQLSVRAPGNLVIQNSGHYGNLESVSGSIRIEPNVEVEAVSVSCAETCYVQGNLTAWKVFAKCLHLEEEARAHIVLQETERLEIGKEARLVGNFGSEKELFFLFSRFSQQVRSLPFYQESRDTLPPMEAPAELPPPSEELQDEDLDRASGSLSLLSTTDPTVTQELPDALFFSLVLLERDGTRNPDRPAEVQRVLQELMKLLRERDLETLQHTYRTLFSRVPEPSHMIQRSEELVAGYFGGEPAAANSAAG